MEMKTAVVMFIIVLAALGVAVYLKNTVTINRSPGPNETPAFETPSPPTTYAPNLHEFLGFVVEYNESVTIRAGDTAKTLYTLRSRNLKEPSTFNLSFIRKPPRRSLGPRGPPMLEGEELPEGISASIEPQQLTIRPGGNGQTAIITMHVDSSVKPGRYIAAILAGGIVEGESNHYGVLFTIEVIGTP